MLPILAPLTVQTLFFLQRGHRLLPFFCDGMFPKRPWEVISPGFRILFGQPDSQERLYIPVGGGSVSVDLSRQVGDSDCVFVGRESREGSENDEAREK